MSNYEEMDFDPSDLDTTTIYEQLDCAHCEGCKYALIEDDSIGSYEYHGQQCIQPSNPYLVCEHPDSKTGEPEDCPKRIEE